MIFVIHPVMLIWLLQVFSVIKGFVDEDVTFGGKHSYSLN